ncbi:MAG: VTT domain-containing protein [Caldilineaceae bacterium]|nr:VTT domain-containing protein [Caldilineaceae bacterium]
MNFDFQWLDAFWDTMQSGGIQELGRGNYLLLFLLILVEGPIATLLAAAAASAGFMRISVVIGVSAVANLFADIAWYSLGYFSNEETLIRYLGWLGLRRRHLEKLRWAMRRHARKALLIAKFSTGFAIPALVAAGLSRIPLRRWFPVVFLAGVGWSTVLALVGFYATEAIKNIQTGLHYLAVIGLAAIFILFLYLAHRGMRSTRSFVDTIDDDPAPREAGSRPFSAPEPADPKVTPAE